MNYTMTAQSRLDEILASQTFVTLTEYYRGTQPPEIRDAITGRVLLRTRSRNIMWRELREKGWHLVDRIKPKSEALSTELVKEGWQPLASIPERKPIQVYLNEWRNPHASTVAFVYLQGTWFVAEPFAYWDEFSPPIAWRPWIHEDLVVRGNDPQ